MKNNKHFFRKENAQDEKKLKIGLIAHKRLINVKNNKEAAENAHNK
ncbi:MAG: hypothetical protein Q4A74_09050 [Cardiobacteriaceae bacterium]|nr:hypothetical protein [Cardiobacteriaceae bacterium]